ncbi:hypothetical protein BvCmsNSP001_00582 [Escherichia coli]|uniref:hypothetical protein n=1 Tax=Escherichia coli TaxID=562 RepID=UPI0010CC9CE5|nr:hypothetical protein [Escherichia coli]GDN92252.1 hypothetical protein BvCmsNSP001_00582 [Escherichia coli]
MEFYKAKPTGILYQIDGNDVYYLNDKAMEWRICHAHLKHEIENHPEYFIPVNEWKVIPTKNGNIIEVK